MIPAFSSPLASFFGFNFSINVGLWCEGPVEVCPAPGVDPLLPYASDTGVSRGMLDLPRVPDVGEVV